MSGRHRISRASRLRPTRTNIAVLGLATFGLFACAVAALVGVATAPKVAASQVSDPVPSPPARASVTSGVEARFDRAVIPDLVPDDIVPYEVVTATESKVPAPPVDRAGVAVPPTTPAPPIIGAPPPVLQPAPQTEEEPVAPAPAEPAPTVTPAEPTTDPEPTQEPLPTVTEPAPTTATSTGRNCRVKINGVCVR